MEFDLHDWQEAALDTWIQKGKKGIVEAVTGAGKTYLALAAINHLYNECRKLRTIIVVPTIALQVQWKERVTKLLPGTKVGLWGDGYHDSIATHQVIVSTIQTAVVKGPERLRQLGSLKQWKKFLIADECHRYVNAETFAKIRLELYWDCVLAMTATLGSDDFNIPGFGKVIYTYNFPKAVADGLVPKFNLLNIHVPLTQKELQKYTELTEMFSDRISWVNKVYEEQLWDIPYDFFFRKLSQILKNEVGNHIPIRALFKTLFERAAIAYLAHNKLKLAKSLLETMAIEGQRKIIVFFERIASIDDLLGSIEITHEEKTFFASALVDQTMGSLAEELEKEISGTWIGEIHSGLKPHQRQLKLDEFKREQPAILLTCRMLDEGIDVPDIDAAILVASTKSKRQRIQRFGRVLRKSAKKPLIVTLIVPQTNEGQIIQDDEENFEGAADLHNAEYTAAKNKVLELMVEKSEEAMIDESPPSLAQNHWVMNVSLLSKAPKDKKHVQQKRSNIILLITDPNSGRDLEHLPHKANRVILKRTIDILMKRLNNFNPFHGHADLPNGETIDAVYFTIEEEIERTNLPLNVRHYFRESPSCRYFCFRNPLNTEDEWETYLLSGNNLDNPIQQETPRPLRQPN